VSVETYFQQRAEQFHALYGEEAAWQRWLNRWLRAGLYERAEIATSAVTEHLGDTVLDVGCGSGRNSVLFVKAGAGRVLGIDMAENMVTLARQFSRDHNAATQTEFICADFMQYSDNARFDHAVALGVFDYISEPVPVLAKMASLAKKKVIASFPGTSLLRAPLRKVRYAMRGCPVYFYTEPDLQRIFAEAGMPQAKIVPYASSGFMGIAKLDAGDGSQ
jgi:ubiquinone/menaquinone biosynthesis C-methylase UbiE